MGGAGSRASDAIPVQREVSPWVSALVLSLVVLLFILIRVRLRDMPLERDEGEYAYAGQLMLEGIPPYKLAYNMKLPGTYAAYAVILFVFGQTPSGIHIGLMLINAATSVMMFFVGKRLFGSLAGMGASAAYALLSTGGAILGLQGHATHFVVLAAVAGLLLLFKADETGRPSWFLWSGISFGLAFLMKQPGIFFAVFAALWLVQREWRRRQVWSAIASRAGGFLLGVSLPFTLTCLSLWRAGVFDKFWFWVFDYALAYGNTVSLRQGLTAFEETAPKIVGPAALVWILSGIGASAFLWDRSVRRHAFLCLGLLLFSFAAVCLGLFFRPHYFILMLPAIALLAGVALYSTTAQIFKHWPRIRFLVVIPTLVFAVAFCHGVLAQADFFFKMDPVTACRYVYPAEVFEETRAVGDYIQSNSSSTARIAVLGASPEVFFYAHRHSATGFIYIFSLLERQKYASDMQREMIEEIEAARPEYLVLEPVWLMRLGGDEERLAWTKGYTRDYDLVGLVERLGPAKTEIHWGADALVHHPGRPAMYIFRRKGT